MCSVFSNALSLGRKRSGTKILGGLPPLAAPSQNQVPAFPYGLKPHYTNHLSPNFREFFLHSGETDVFQLLRILGVCGFAAIGRLSTRTFHFILGLYSDRNNPVKVSIVPIIANKVSFSCRISTEVMTVITGTI